MSKSKPVRSFSRGLAVLAALNQRNFSTVSQISQAARLPRATTHRLLETLIGEGYVSRSADGDVYSLREDVLALSSGLTDEARATDLSRPLVDALSAEIVWPMNVLIAEGPALMVRHSTHGQCPRSLLSRSNAGMRVPLLATSAGRIYLAKLPKEERLALIEQAGESSSAAADLVEEAAMLGYGYRDTGMPQRTNSIAVAVCADGRPVACISATFIRSVVTQEVAVERYLPALRDVVRSVEARLAA